MDIDKADFWTVIKFGNIESFLEKLNIENKSIEDVVNSLDKNGISLLQKSLISRKFEIAKFLIENNANVNIVSNEGCNELHYIAANINCIGAVDLAEKLVELNVDLNLKDKKNGNSAIFSLCQEVLKERSNRGNNFIVKCLKRQPNINDLNKFDYTLKEIIKERGTEDMKKVLEAMK